MNTTEAQSRLASLDIREWDSVAIQSAVLTTTTALLHGSPQVAPLSTSPGTWFVGASGMDGIGGEQQLAHTLLAIARTIHPDAKVAIADSCVAARAATWSAPTRTTIPTTTRTPAPGTPNHSCTYQGITILPKGGCAAWLAPAPIGLIPMSKDMRDSLKTLGLNTVGAFAAVDPGDVERRWGADGLASWRLAHGDDPRRPGVVRVDAARTASIELPAPAQESTTILFAARALLQRLIHELVADGRAAASVAVTLALDAGRYQHFDGSTDTATLTPFLTPHPTHLNTSPRTNSHTNQHTDPQTQSLADSLLSIPHRTITREIRPARPIAQFDPLFQQCRSLLESWTLPAPVIGVALSIPATAPLSADQGDLLISSWRDAAMKADAVFAQLRKTLDPPETGDVVVHPVLNNSQRPEHAASWVSADAMQLAKPTTTPATTHAVATPGVATLHALPVDGGRTVHALPVSGAQSPDGAKLLPVMRLLPAPETIQITETSSGQPAEAWWRGERMVFVHAEGPDRLSGDWWRADSYARDYWRCTTDSSAGLLLYKSRKKWFLQGWYD